MPLYEIDRWNIHIDVNAEQEHEWPHLQGSERKYLNQRTERITFGKPAAVRRANRMVNLLNPMAAT